MTSAFASHTQPRALCASLCLLPPASSTGPPQTPRIGAKIRTPCCLCLWANALTAFPNNRRRCKLNAGVALRAPPPLWPLPSGCQKFQEFWTVPCARFRDRGPISEPPAQSAHREHNACTPATHTHKRTPCTRSAVTARAHQASKFGKSFSQALLTSASWCGQARWRGPGGLRRVLGKSSPSVSRLCAHRVCVPRVCP